MVEYQLSLDSVFGALADPTRRDIMSRVSKKEMAISEIAHPYHLTFAAISKHLKVLEKAKLIIKRHQGKKQLVSAVPEAFTDIDKYLEQYHQLWEARMDSLEDYLKQTKGEYNGKN